MVYVDRPIHKLGRMVMCHMLADSLDELHAMADKIGLKRSWFQTHSTPHYDICKSNRALAISHGAIEIGNKQVVALIKRLRTEKTTSSLTEPHEGLTTGDLHDRTNPLFNNS